MAAIGAITKLKRERHSTVDQNVDCETADRPDVGSSIRSSEARFRRVAQEREPQTVSSCERTPQQSSSSSGRRIELLRHGASKMLDRKQRRGGASGESIQSK
jgi:hypothetical protein